MPEPGRTRELPALWRTPVAYLAFLLCTVLWMLMIIRSDDTLFFEPTSSAVARAAAARGPVLALATGSLPAVGLLAWTARRVVLLVLAVPAATMIMLQAFSPGSASTVICIVATVLVGTLGAGLLVVDRLARPGQPVTIRGAALLTSAYAVTLCVLVAVLLSEQFTGTGHVGRLQLSGLSLRGFVVTTAGLTLVALLLGTGSALLGQPRSGSMITVPLLGLFLFGAVGQAVDVIGGHTSARSNGIGFAILVLMILPVVLLRVRSSREYLSARPLARPRC